MHPETEHPDIETLVAARLGSLGRDEHDQVRDHLADCPRCSDLARTLEDSEGLPPPIAVDAEELDGAWRHLRENLPPAGARSATARRQVPMALAAVLALALVGLGLITGVRERELRRLRGTQATAQAIEGSVRLIDLFPQGFRRGAATETAPTVSLEGATVLAFHVPGPIDDAPVRLTLAGPGDDPLELPGLLRTPEGLVTVFVPHGALDAGRYRVEIRAADPQPVLATYHFDVVSTEGGVAEGR